MELKPGYKQTEVGVIPEDWKVRQIKAVCKLINGRGFKPFEWEKTGLPIIRIQNINGSDEFNFYQGIYDKKLEIDPGQLLFAWSGSRGTSFGPHIWQGPRGLLNYHTWKVQIYESEVDKGFFLHALKQLTNFIEGKAHGASALVHTQKWEMEGFEFPLPPTKAEQEAIAEALGDADALIESLEHLIAKKRQIKQGAMQKLLQPKDGWVETCLLELASGKKELFDDGDWIEAEHITTKGVRLVQTGNIGVGKFVEKGAKKYIFESSFVTLRCKEIKEGDLLICRLADPAGRACVLPDIGEDKIVTSVDVTIFRPSSSIANRVFLANFFSTDQWFRDVSDRSGGTTRKRISRGALGRLKISVPPLDGQTAIAAVLSDMDAEIAALEAKLDKTRQLKQGMMHNLLTGKIRLV